MNGVNLSVLFLSVQTGVFIGVLVAAAVIFAALGAFVGYTIYKKNTEKKVGEANERVRKIIGDAESEAGQIRAEAQAESKRALKEALLEAKEQDLKLRNDFERETKEKKAEIQKMEQRITQKEDALDKKTEALEEKKSAPSTN